MKRNWKDLGEVWSGRDLDVGEMVTFNVFDKTLNILLEQISFRACNDHRGRYVWLQDFCHYINAHSALVRTGVENAAGNWQILDSSYRNHYWNLTSRDLLVTTTVPGVWNFHSDRFIPLHATHSQPIGTRMRVNVRTSNDVLLETFLVELDWFGMHQWPRDLATQINARSHFVRAGRAIGERIHPEAGATENAIWLPYNGDFKVSWFPEAVSVNADLEDDRNVGYSEKQPLFVFDYNADRLVERSPLVVPADGSACKAFLLDEASEEILEETDVNPTLDLQAKDRVKVTINARGQGAVCETLNFTPVANRLKVDQWHHDLSVYINAQSRYIKAWLQDEGSKSCVARDEIKGNLYWSPVWSGLDLQVKLEVASSGSPALPAAVQKKDEPVPVGSAQCTVLWPCDPARRAFNTAMGTRNWVKGPALGSKGFEANQQMVIRVKGKTGRIFESLVFWPEPGRMGLQAWSQDLCNQINASSKFLRAGEAGATSFTVKASGNCFWTPAGSELVVEAEILSGFSYVAKQGAEQEAAIGSHDEAAEPLPGMISEDKKLFDHYAAMGRLISVDAQTGGPTLNIPVADLYADDSLSQPLKVSLSLDDGIFLRFGNTNRYLAMPGGRFSKVFILPLRDGRRVKVDASMVDDINGGDFCISPIRSRVSDELKTVGFTVGYKDGRVDDYMLTGRTNEGGIMPLTRYAIASGNQLDIKFSQDKMVDFLKVIKESDTLLEVIYSRGSNKLRGVVVYPASSTEKVTWTFSNPDKSEFRFEVDGLGADGKAAYCVTTDDTNRLVSVEVEQQYSFTVNGKTETDKAVYKETLEYDDAGKVKQHIICPGAGMDDLVHEYTYSDKGGVLTGYFKNATPKTVFTRTHDFSDEQTCEDKHGISTAPVVCKRSHGLDTATQCLVSSTKMWEGEVQVEDQTVIVDALGNPLSRGENDRITRYTYYNNYKQYTVTKSEEKVQNTSFLGWLLKPLDYLFPTGWACLIGGKGGFTWGTYLKTTVNMEPAKNDYAKDAFNLPVDIVHCGSDQPFSGDVESELVTRKVNGVEQAQSLTYFGYENINGRVRLKKKLTVLQPNYKEVDVADKQLKVATAAAQKFIDSLNKEIASADKDSKKTFESTLTGLKESLKAQSEVNRTGYQLGTWKSASMSVETYEYHTDSSKAGYGTVKSIKRVLLDKEGKEVAASLRTTTMEYSQVDKDATRVVIKTTVSRGNESVTSSQTRSRHTGRLYESADSEGVKTVYTYDGQGNLASETVSKGDKQYSKTTVTPARKLGWLFELVEGNVTNRLEKDVLGRKVAMWVKPKDATAFLETRGWTYDSCGRAKTAVENDYGAENKLVSKRQTTWSYDSTSGKLRIDNVLKDGAGKEAHKVSQSLTPEVQGELFNQGTFSITRKFLSDSNTLTERYANADGDGCRIERGMTADGVMKSIRYVRIDKKNFESEAEKISFDHDAYGQMKKVTPGLGAASEYEYDSAGRLLKTTRDGTSLINAYDTSTLAPVSAKGTVEWADKKNKIFSMALGEQSIDLLDRVTSQTINGTKTEFSYTGGSTVSTLKTIPKAPKAMTGYSSSMDAATRTETQTLKQDNVDQKSTLLFSTGGRVLSFTDLTGETTKYEHDFFDRVISSKNNQCESTFVYADNGLLTSETIKAVKANMTMTVTYVYDELGQETARNFTCAGLETLAVNRHLLADGRTKACFLMEGEREKYFNRYEYDDSLRLKKWTSTTGDDEYTYDSLGNIITGLGTIFSYDGSKPGVLTEQASLDNPRNSTPVTCDAAGRLTSDVHGKVSYHANGQINVFSHGEDHTFTYDAEGRVRGTSTSKRSDTYHYRGDCAYAVVQSDSGKSDGYSKRTLVLRNDSRACLMQDALVDGDDNKTTRSFELRDSAGTVVASIDLGSKSITFFNYSPYGKRVRGGKSENWLGFKGEPRMLGSREIYYLGNGYRAYDALSGRFLSRDSLSPFGAGGAAAYVFCDGDPVNKHDPSGHEVIAQYERWSTVPIIETTAFRIVTGALGVVLAPFTAGMSVALAAATTALAVIAFSFDMASYIISESDPELSKTLEAWGQAFAIAGAAAGIAMMLDGFKGIPRNIFKLRGSPVHPQRLKNGFYRPATRVVQTTEDLMITQRAVNEGVRLLREAKGVSSYKALSPFYLPPESAFSVAAVGMSGSHGGSMMARLGNTTKNLFTGVIREIDDSFDLLGLLLDMNSGPNTVISKFQSPPPGETTTVSIVSGPFPGREKLFP
ncbi:MAG: hypothetical protein LBJ37_15235 [Paucimonas sp.]|jgi:RHS repeat-associated protein|nr:hypothetical protein [Paucimonas sp.]